MKKDKKYVDVTKEWLKETTPNNYIIIKKNDNLIKVYKKEID